MFLEELVKKRLKELHPDFDYVHVENIMYRTALQDIEYYFKTMWNIETHVQFMSRFTDTLAERPWALKEEIDAWLSLWFSKWKQRVKLFFKEEEFNRSTEQLQKMVMRGSNRIGYQMLQEYKRPVIICMIQNDEICFVDQLAEQLIKRVLAKFVDQLAEQLIKRVLAKERLPKGIEGKIEFLNILLNKVKDLSNTSGPLIFLKPNMENFR